MWWIALYDIAVLALTGLVFYWTRNPWSFLILLVLATEYTRKEADED